MNQQEVMEKFMDSLDKTTLKGNKAVDEAILTATGGKFKISSLKKQLLSDYDTSKNGEEFLEKYCGIDLSNDDTGAITGSDAGGSKTKNSKSIIPDGTFSKSFNNTSFTTNGVTFRLCELDYWDGYLWTVDSLSGLTSLEKHIWRGLYSFWAEESLNLIEQSYGYSFEDSDTEANTIRVYFVDDEDSNALAKTYNHILTSFDEEEEYIHIGINLHYFENISTSDSEGKVPSDRYPYWQTDYLDRTIAHELTHAIMVAKVSYCYTLPAIIIEGLAELTGGIDDIRYNDILAGVKNKSTLKKLLVFQDDYNEVYGVNAPDYVGGYIFLRYLARQFGDLTISNDTSNTIVSGFYGNDTIYNYAKSVTVKSGAGDDEIYGSSNNDTLYGEAGNDSLSGGNGNDKLYGGSGKDSLYGDADNDTLYGDSGSDSLSGGNGKDLLYGGNEADYLYGDAGNDTLYGGKGNDILYGGNEDDKLYGEAGADYLYGDSGNDTLYGNTGNDSLSGGKGNDKLYGGSDKDKLYGNSGDDTLYGDSGSDSLSGGNGKDLLYGGNEADYLYGDAGNDTLYGGKGNDILYGGNEDDKLYGGSGDDTLTGGEGNDLFVYESGNDVITDYTEGVDSIKISSGYISSRSYSNNDVIFNIGSGTLTVKNGSGKSISVTNSSNVTKTYSKTATLFDDDNFISNDANLDSITEQKFTVQNIENQNYDNLAQDFNKLVTYADK